MVTTFGCPAPQKFLKAKNVQNLAEFRTTLDFDHEYLWGGLRYRQAVNGVTYLFNTKVVHK